MTAPMSDARLAEIRRSLNRGPLTRGEALDLMAEIDRLRAELAARPEPIGYTVASTVVTLQGPAVLLGEEGFEADTLEQAREILAWRRTLPHLAHFNDVVVALVPVDAPPPAT